MKHKVLGFLFAIVFCCICYLGFRFAIAFLINEDYKDTEQMNEYFQEDGLNNEASEYSLDDIISQFSIEEDDDTIISYKRIEHIVKNGESMDDILLGYKIPQSEVKDIISGALKKKHNIFNIKKNQIITFDIKEREIEPSDEQFDVNTANGTKNKITEVSSITLKTDIDKYLLIKRTDDGFLYDTKIIELQKKMIIREAVIDNSLFYDGIKAGLSAESIMSIIAMYSYDIDFARDLKQGDSFTIASEELFDENGKSLKTLRILYSRLNTASNGKLEYFYYEPSKYYFNGKGESVQKSLLKTPINGARISSKFGHRRHPILGYTKLHKGIDFAAPRGTPIFAAGDGVIVYRGIYKGYGNYIKVKHNQTYSTAYAHMSRFAPRFRNGSKVKQGQVIGYVGSTGFSTGNHLHYELFKGSSQINPQSIKTRSNQTLSNKQLKDFIYRLGKFKKDNDIK
jgi:murein DD-endopeptidase MepM/ murein hydrolase activator NlpD